MGGHVVCPGPAEVSSALRRRLAGRFPGEVADAGAPVRISGGLDFWVYGPAWLTIMRFWLARCCDLRVPGFWRADVRTISAGLPCRA